MAVTRVEKAFGQSKLILESGKLAKQAHGSVTVQMGDTVVLTAATSGGVIPGRDFFPLQVEYRERTYAAGKFPGGFIKRETRPSTKETLTSRFIDRPIRPLFPAGYINEVQVMATVMAADKENDPDILGIISASAALHISTIPFTMPIGAVRVGRIGEQLIAMPTHTQMEESDLDLVVAATREAVCMIEGFARELPEDIVTAAIVFAHQQCVIVIEAIEELREKLGLGKKELPPAPPENPLVDELHKKIGDEFKKAYLTHGKLARYAALDALKAATKKEYFPEGATETKYTPEQFSSAFSTLKEKIFQEITMTGTRIDGRAARSSAIDLAAEVQLLPRVHGSALFQRGETQALVDRRPSAPVRMSKRWTACKKEYSKKFIPRLQLPLRSASASASRSGRRVAAKSATACWPSVR